MVDLRIVDVVLESLHAQRINGEGDSVLRRCIDENALDVGSNAICFWILGDP